MARSTLYEEFLARQKGGSAFHEGVRVLVACSGGPDSVALLDILAHYAPTAKIKVFVCHLNHCLRGADSDEDARFVGALAKKMGLEAYIGRRDVAKLAQERHVSIETAARDARYEFFNEAAAKMRCFLVATAHTLNDNAETILQRLIEGSGPEGLSGIPGWRLLSSEGKKRYLVRPLLFASRAKIEEYLESRGLEYRVDKTNLEPIYLRNRIRLEIMPKLREINPSFEESLVRSSELVSDLIGHIGEEVDRAERRIVKSRREPVIELECYALIKTPRVVAREALKQILVGAGVGWRELKASHIESVIDLAAGKSPSSRIDLPGGIEARRSYDMIFVGPRAAFGKLEEQGLPNGEEPPSGPPQPPVEVFQKFYRAFECPGSVNLPGGLGEIAALETAPEWFRMEEFLANKGGFDEAIDGEAVEGGYAVRFPQPGDRFRPLGAPGARKLQDIFVDAKIPASERARIPIVEDMKGIIWVPGVRIVDRVKVTPQTQDFVVLTWIRESGDSGKKGR